MHTFTMGHTIFVINLTDAIALILMAIAVFVFLTKKDGF